ncbi:MAG TPA: hypothetical protein VJB90_01100 [Candidatus Nanoarchaeia archaeon]|nr:hypothetical protein [Candidatus Nanoarchaeia archaeon]
MKTGCNVINANAVKRISCSDTDGGADPTVKGTVKITQGKTTTTYTDSCVSSSTVKEYYCVSGKLNSTNIACSAGFFCTDGACVLAPVPPTNTTNST